MSVACPIECMQNLNPPDWLEKHNAFVLTLVGILGGGLGVLLSYFLNSRCKKIDICCAKCERDVLQEPTIELPPTRVELVS